MLDKAIKNKESGFLFYGLTPPKISTEEEKIAAIAARQISRLKDEKIDALVLYDIQDESLRISAPRPYPFSQTLLPQHYNEKYLKAIDVPKIIYQTVGKYTKEEFTNFLTDDSYELKYSVLVGTPTDQQSSGISLLDAYKIKEELDSPVILGGITIPERHIMFGDEHKKVFFKIDKGCSFFISQCVYSLNDTKSFLSDYYYYSMEIERQMAPIIFTLTPCGSLKTLEFMQWLGIDVPRWLFNELTHSQDILSKSLEVCRSIAAELLDYCLERNIPVGFNIESVAIRKVEVEASIELLRDVRKMLEENIKVKLK